MGITRRFGRIGSVLLPIALLAVFFKYLHPLNAILHGVEGWGLERSLSRCSYPFLLYGHFFM